jgi:hypothetical protein
MAKILSERDVALIGAINKTYWDYRLCTKKRAEALNCNVTSPSNATDNQLIYEVTKAHDYTLWGPNSITWYTGLTSATIGIYSAKDNSWLQPSVQSKSAFITYVSISQSSGANGQVSINFDSNVPKAGQITFIQPESGLTHRVNILKPEEKMYVSVKWMGTDMWFSYNAFADVFLYFQDNSGSQIFYANVRFNNGNPTTSLTRGMKATGYTNTTGIYKIIYKVRIKVDQNGNTCYDKTTTLSTPVSPSGSLYVSLYDNGILQQTSN